MAGPPQMPSFLQYLDSAAETRHPIRLMHEHSPVLSLQEVLDGSKPSALGGRVPGLRAVLSKYFMRISCINGLLQNNRHTLAYDRKWRGSDGKLWQLINHRVDAIAAWGGVEEQMQVGVESERLYVGRVLCQAVPGIVFEKRERVIHGVKPKFV
ncbi:hypothetical protein PILCRDRAFT_638692 [Piloderma croceum F 1598]|uniref:Uncharacterized protein n=1 Tax=Piloderma croceum (strain F 1598) TaxID=765440 RepID=A0A0C3BHJ9_PILCF|nr:hypothetical protein PILCRDRAFT_638692 [Piloderma croceum F 1598]